MVDNVGYGTGQGLSGYGLGDQVVRRDQMGVLDPVTGTALEWNPGSNAFAGVKALEATPRGLFAGGDGNIQGGLPVGRVGFYDLSRVPQVSPVDTKITTPIEGRVVTSGSPFQIKGTATAPTGVTKVQLEIQNRIAKQYLQDDLVTWGRANSVNAALASASATATSWTLDLTLTGSAQYRILAKTFGRNRAQDSTKAVKQIESFTFDDQTPTTSISSPPSGLLNTTSFVASGTATDDNGVNELTYWFRNATNQYLQDDGSVAPTFNTFRGEPDVVGAKTATWKYEVHLPSEGDWRMSATAIDNAGQADLRSAIRDGTISAAGSPPTVAISAPVTMTPPTVASPVTVIPGQPLTFAGSATDDDRLQDVEIYLRNSSTGEALAADGTWSANSVAAFHRISPSNMSTSSYSWGYTTPFNLTPGTYDFRVRATDDLGLITPGANQGRLTINAQTDAFPNGLLNFTGAEQNVDTLHLDLGGTATDDLGLEPYAWRYTTWIPVGMSSPTARWQPALPLTTPRSEPRERRARRSCCRSTCQPRASSSPPPGPLTPLGNRTTPRQAPRPPG